MHLYVQAPFLSAVVAESTVMKQHHYYLWLPQDTFTILAPEDQDVYSYFNLWNKVTVLQIPARQTFLELKSSSRTKDCEPKRVLKVPKREIFVTEIFTIFTLTNPIWVGDLRHEPKKCSKVLGWYSPFGFFAMTESSAKLFYLTLSLR